MSILLFDIGGTNMRVALGDGETVTHVQKFPTPTQPKDAVTLLVTYVAHAGVAPTRSSGCIAGTIENSVVVSSKHLPQWNGFHFGEELARELAISTVLINDAEAAGIGEALFGAGKGYSRVGYMGIGTGVGGAYIVDGTSIPHTDALEPGHQILDIATGATLEEFVSGSALSEQFHMPAPLVDREVYTERTAALATGLYNLMLEWSPEVFVLGGSLMNEENGYRLEEIETALRALPTVVPHLPKLVRSELGDHTGLYGALHNAP